MKTGHREPGFTMIELMIVMAVIAILAAIAYPMFTSQIQQGRRADAQQELVDLALQEEKYRANHVSYGTCADLFGGASCPDVSGGSNWGYTVTVLDPGPDGGPNATNYTLQATATGDQASDKEGSTSCTPLTLDESDNKCPAVCWDVDPASVNC